MPKAPTIREGWWIALLLAACALLAVLQFQWTGELSRVEIERTQASAAERLQQIAAGFDRELAQQLESYLPAAQLLLREDWPKAVAAQWQEVTNETSDDSPPLLKNLHLAVPDAARQRLQLWRLAPPSAAWPPGPAAPPPPDQPSGPVLQLVDWPASPAWQHLANALTERMAGLSRRPMQMVPADSDLVEIPVFGPQQELAWVVAEADTDKAVPALFARLARSYGAGFRVAVRRLVVPAAAASEPSSPNAPVRPNPAAAQGLVWLQAPAESSLSATESSSAEPPSAKPALPGEPPLFRAVAFPFNFLGRGSRGLRGDPGLRGNPSLRGDPSLRGNQGLRGPEGRPNEFERPNDFGRPPRPNRTPSAGRWEVVAWPESGPLSTIVNNTRRKNLGVALALLALIAAAGYALVRNTRKARQLAEAQFQFVAGVSHELRTPLTVIQGAGENLLSGVVKGPEQQAKYARAIVKQASQLHEMVEQLLAYGASQHHARRQGFASGFGLGRLFSFGRPVPPPAAASLQAVELLPVITDAIESAGLELEDTGRTLDVALPPDLPSVQGRPSELRRVLWNLLTNAIRHGEGEISISAQLVENRAGQPPCVEIQVHDAGPGIPEAELPHLFEPFFRGSRARHGQTRGTGLGLSLVRELMETMGGQVRVESSKGQGTTFTLTLRRVP